MRTLSLAVPFAAALLLITGLPAVCMAAVPAQFDYWGVRAREHSYLRPAGPSPLEAGALAATAQETARGFVLLSAPPTASIAPSDVLSGGERTQTLQAQDCPGQYGAVQFFLVPLRDGQASIRARELRSAAGGGIPAENLEVRAVRCVGVDDGPDAAPVPLLLEREDPAELAARTPRAFRLTYYVPPGTPPGLYGGSLEFRLDPGEAAAIPLELNVLGFELDAAPCSLYIYSSSPPDAAGLGRWQAELIDQHCHGMTMAMVTPPVTREGELRLESLEALLDVYARVGFAERHIHMGLWNRVTAEWLNAPDRSIGMWGPWFRYYPFSEELDARYVRTVRRIQGAARERNLELVLAVADEAGSHAWTIPAAQHYLDLLAAEVPDVVLEQTVGGGWAMGEPEHDLWRGRLGIWTTNRWLPERLATVRAQNAEARIQLYNMGGPGSAAGSLQAARTVYGFFGWKAGADGVAQWVYHHASTPQHNYVWPAEDGRPVPTLRWEAVREGVKDRRYLATLENRLAGRTGLVADEARAFLDDIRSQIELRNVDWNPIDGGRVPSLPPGTYDEWRRRIAELIEGLEADRGPR
jgi:hypothetical protein